VYRIAPRPFNRARLRGIIHLSMETETKPSLPARIGRFAVVLVQLGAIGAAVHLFEIEESLGFVKLLPVITGGFAVHCWLPLKFRQPFFVLLGFGAALYILGPIEGALLCAAGLVLIGLCHLPIPFPARVVLVLLAAGALAALRAEWIATPWSSTVLPILGAMFMFRLMIYLYDLRHEKARVSPFARLAYFFMLPNVCFPLFPVVDYKMFQRTYFNEDDFAIYQKGLRWILVGAIHLLLYRAVYLYLIPAPSRIEDLYGVIEFAVSAYLQYLRISGQFHVIVGVLCLFGFNLPATNRWFFFAASLTDMWRRINVYWRDFSQKIIYFPIFMRLRKIGQTKAMVLATAAVFVCSWLLHSYQWFWIRGEFPIAAVDMVFWGVIAVAVIATSLVEARRKPASHRRARHPLLTAFGRAAGTLGVFCLMCVLWSLWCSDSPSDWVDTISRAGGGGAGQLAVVAGVLAGILVAGTLAALAAAKGLLRAPRFGFWSGAAVTGGVAVALVGCGLAAQRLERRHAAAEYLASLMEPRLNERDAELRTLGYYEGLLAGDDPGEASDSRPPARVAPIAPPPEVEQSTEAPPDWLGAGEAGITRRVPDYRVYELKKLYSTVFKRAEFSTNSWGMRDKFYPRKKPPKTYRIALLGASPEMGSGLADGENYESVLERLLNQKHSPRTGIDYEVLNFGVAGWGISQQVAKCEADLFDFEPDAVLLTAHTGRDVNVSLRLFLNILRRGLTLPDELAAILEQERIHKRMRKQRVVRVLLPRYEEITRFGYRKVVEHCRLRGVVPIWVYIPLPEDFHKDDQLHGAEEAELASWAREAGFEMVSLSGVYDGVDPTTLTLAPWDHHPNVEGSRLIGMRLYRELVKRPELITGEDDR
jgi:hypothetical protein